MFRPYAKCIHCGVTVDWFGDDETGDEDCYGDDRFVGVHEFNYDDPWGEYSE